MAGETTAVNDRRVLFWTVVAIFGFVALGVAYWLAFGPVPPFPTSQPISYGTQLDDRTIELGWGCTQGSDDIDVVQESDQVVVRIRARSHSGDCASGLTLGLDAPLDDRVVIDGSTGERVEVRDRLVPERP